MAELFRIGADNCMKTLNPSLGVCSLGDLYEHGKD
jgi:hypothetical protein